MFVYVSRHCPEHELTMPGHGQLVRHGNHARAQGPACIELGIKQHWRRIAKDDMLYEISQSGNKKLFERTVSQACERSND